jgi:transcriptional antiterminator RfaH
MPILSQMPPIFPDHLLAEESTFAQAPWYCCVTVARAEKALIRLLRGQQIPHYCPLVIRRFRSPNGRMRRSQLPLFTSYVFMCGDESQRVMALATKKISRLLEVPRPAELIEDLRRIHQAIQLELPLTAEERITTGQFVRVRSGPFAGYEGIVLRRDGKTRLVLSIRFLDQSISLEIDQALLEVI